MTAPNTLLNNGVPIPNAQWAEFISRTGEASGAANFSYEGGNQAVIVYTVPWTQVTQATADLLGVNTVVLISPTAGSVISRKPPANHPTYVKLFASKITVAPRKWTQKLSGFFGTTSLYDKAFLVTTFTQPKFRVLDDGQLDRLFPPVSGIRQEQNRFVEYVPQIGVETLVREGGTVQGATGANFKWCEGPNSGTAFNSPTPQALPKGDLILLQRRVPLYKGILWSGPTPQDLTNHPPYTTAKNLEALIGTVNLASFLGRPAQTLRFNGYRITPVESPIDPAIQLAGFGGDITGIPTLVCDVEYSFSFWNPPPFGTTTGHNLAPIPGSTTGLWGAISPSGTIPDATHAGIYTVSDWSTMFQPPG